MEGFGKGAVKGSTRRVSITEQTWNKELFTFKIPLTQFFKNLFFIEKPSLMRAAR